MAECIHGFDEGLCDICFPREEPKKAVAAPKTRARAASVGPRSRVPGSSRKAPELDSAPFAERRIYHVTHLRNLDAIFIDGAIRSSAVPEFDIASPFLRERRAGVEVAPDAPLTDFVSFSLSPHASWWDEVRTGAHDGRWSPEARQSKPTQFAVLVGTVAAVGPEIVVSDGDAGAPSSRFGVGSVAASQLARRAELADPELLDAEVLVRGEYPLAKVAVLAVPNEPVRDHVRATLRESGTKAPRIVVYPPWFLPVPENV
ncbi:DarT ssDNA thymidine ADP-ribosyltransferase family protein [Herbiconiux sp. L3-i23]|uniref:DarT ssDNA thymidine ADP-ribosyltransferase family protein n=1 Tax=Herbiconiux sp. L3-i23 TaxID=2905871 RepID=UPI002073A5F9|nr:DarT ssDNA thymidine ADP-ribosyltransferase family protein [Herbiconiux sp. L3-i23]